MDPSDTRKASNPYENPDLARWLGSFEGGLEPPRPSLGQRLRSASWRQRGNMLLAWLGEVAPGVMLAIVLAVVAEAVAQWMGTTVLGFQKSPISAVMLAVAVGLIVRNTLGLPTVYEHGLALCLKRLLRIGVALLGIRLSLAVAGEIGLQALPIVVGCILAALLLVAGVGRWLGLSRRLSTLIGVGTSICGVSAIVATGPVIDADDDEVSYSVATITLFGMVALFAYPLLARPLFAEPEQVGLFLGTAIHDTAQATGAGLMYDRQHGAPAALETTVLVKLLRNACLIGVLPLMAMLHHRHRGAARVAGRSWRSAVPLFVVGFLAMVVVRTVGDAGEKAFGVLSAATWGATVAHVQWAAEWGLMVAMAAVGLGTSLARIRLLGWRPLVAGLVAAAMVGVVSFTLVKVVA